MQYVQFVGDAKVEVRERPAPEPGAGEALVKIAVSAICGSEMHALQTGIDSATRGHHNAGHEVVGVVAAVGPGWCTIGSSATGSSKAGTSAGRGVAAARSCPIWAATSL